MTAVLRKLSRRRASPAMEPLGADTCPLLAHGVVFESTGEDAAWIAVVDGVPSSRVSPAVIELLTAMDGGTTVHALHRRFAASESPESFLRLVGRFRDNGLLEGGAKRAPGRISYRPPFTLQFATLRAPTLFARLDGAVFRPSSRVLVASVAVLLCAGLVAAILQAGDLRDVLTRPLPLGAVLTLIVLLSLITLLHEGAHGLTLTRFGGSPRRAGFMIFYLTPAFFVDVTDGWRLADRRHRVAVALAGPAVHAVVAAAAVLLALAAPRSTVRDVLLLLATSCVVIVLVNLIPFVRFDGYIALMNALDTPNLRGRTISDGANALSRRLFGGAPVNRSVQTWWSVPFGLASLLAPVVMVVLVVTRTVHAFADGGPVLGLFVVALEAVVVLVGCGLLVRALSRVLRSGVSRVRFVGVCVALAAAVVITGTLLPVPATATFGFVADDGRVSLVQGGERTAVEVPDGARVLLSSRGILMNEPLGVGSVRPQPPQPITVPVDALFPVRAEGLTVPAVVVGTVDVEMPERRLPSTGQARIDLGTTNVWQMLWMRGVMAPLSPLWAEEEERQ